MSELQHRLLYPIPEAARLLGIGRSTLYVLLDSGEMDDVYIGKRRLVVGESIDAYIEKLRGASKPATANKRAEVAN